VDHGRRDCVGEFAVWFGCLISPDIEQNDPAIFMKETALPIDWNRIAGPVRDR
jgi:hypothetical protein